MIFLSCCVPVQLQFLSAQVTFDLMSLVVSQTPFNLEDTLFQGRVREKSPERLMPFGGPATHYYISFSFINHPLVLLPPLSQEQQPASQKSGCRLGHGRASQRLSLGETSELP